MTDAWGKLARLATVALAAGRVEGTRSFARLLATVGDPEGAVEAYTKLLLLGICADEEIDVRLLLARQYSTTGRSELAIAPANLEAQRMLP